MDESLVFIIPRQHSDVLEEKSNLLCSALILDLARENVRQNQRFKIWILLGPGQL